MTVFKMKEYKNGEPFSIGSTEQGFKIKIGTGTASVQLQAQDEGYDEITDGGFTSTGFGILKTPGASYQVVLTGDARFFMGIVSNRH